ncbi:hypothetical protein ACH5RR_041778, partial [Cinchona calisaya]
ITYHFFHWKKGTPFSEDQGIYNRLTWWEQIDSGKHLTRNGKFPTVVPVVLSFDSRMSKILGWVSKLSFHSLGTLLYQ